MPLGGRNKLGSNDQPRHTQGREGQDALNICVVESYRKPFVIKLLHNEESRNIDCSHENQRKQLCT